MSEPKFGEWQPISTRPRDHSRILVATKKGVEVWISFASDDVFGGERDVTHWMPLPPPPKEEWEVAWAHFCVSEEFGCAAGDSPFRKAFRKGFEAGRKK